MQKQINAKRKGFTLVELLIVIVVIGILSAMMMLSSTEATTSARASNIVSNLRNLKTAALAFYADNMDNFNTTLAPNEDGKTKFSLGRIIPYMKAGVAVSDKATATDEFAGYVCLATSNRWYVGYNVTDGRIKDKLKGRKEALQLLGSDAAETEPPFTTGKGYSLYDGEGYVWVLVMDTSGQS